MIEERTPLGKPPRGMAHRKGDEKAPRRRQGEGGERHEGSLLRVAEAIAISLCALYRASDSDVAT